MIDIDFLPADYVCVQITRKNNTWLRGLFVAVLVLMGLGWVAQHRVIHDLTRHRNRINVEAESVLAQVDTDESLRRELSDIENGFRLWNGLRVQAPPTRWLTAVVGALPDQATVSEIHTEIEDGSETGSRQPGNTSPGQVKSDAPVDPVQLDLQRLARLTPRRSLSISVRGTATDDLEVSAFLLALHETQLFERVQLLYTDHSTSGNQTLRSFAIKLKIRSLESPRTPVGSGGAPVATGPQSPNRN